MADLRAIPQRRQPLLAGRNQPMKGIPFNRPLTGHEERERVARALELGRIGAGGPYTDESERWISARIGCLETIFVGSATAALDMQAALLDLRPGDEVIMPSFTFVSTATPFVARGAVPVFVDIRSDTLNIDEELITAAVTDRTRAILVVHYAGVACDMDAIMEVAARCGVPVLEDAAHALLSEYRDRPLGSIGSLAALSFHESKNIHCGEGGALLINDPSLCERSQIMADKGTNRAAFEAGEISEYSWVDQGASYRGSELCAAFLAGQLQRADSIVQERLALWHRYHTAFAECEDRGLVKRPGVPAQCKHNGHIYYLCFASGDHRSRFTEHLGRNGINAVRHYVPLHSSPAGRKFGRSDGPLPNTDSAGENLVRLPIWPTMGDRIDRIINCSLDAIASLSA